VSDDDAGFLARWAKRKALVRDGREPTEPASAPMPVVAPPPVAAALPAPPQSAGEPVEPAAPPSPTLGEVATLTPASDFTRFVARGVDPVVRNAALKKLFADPQFNVMDGLDTYIDDYGKPDPLPQGMLRKMVQSQFLGLFSDANPHVEPGAAAQAGADSAPTEPKEASDEDADLRLQPHDAADAGDAGAGGPGAGEDTAREP
jgi:hypothetical protein